AEQGWRRSEQLGISARGSKLRNAPQSCGLVVHVGTQGIQGQGSAVPLAGGAGWRSSRQHSGIPEGAGCMVARLPETALDQQLLQRGCPDSLWIPAGRSAVAGYFAHAARKNEMGAGGENWRGCRGVVLPDASKPVGSLPGGL